MEKSCASREMDCACVGIAMCITRELAHFIVCPKRTVWCLLWCLTWEESHFPISKRNLWIITKHFFSVVFANSSHLPRDSLGP